MIELAGVILFSIFIAVGLALGLFYDRLANSAGVILLIEGVALVAYVCLAFVFAGRR